MDPKALSHLDPKARETYDRIMGTAAAADPTTTPDTTTSPAATDVHGQDMSMIAHQPTAYNSDLGQIVPTSQATPPSQDSSQPSGMQGASPSIFETPPEQETPAASYDASSSMPQTANSSFFINPSPAASSMPAPTDTPQPFAPVEQSQDAFVQQASPDPLSPITPVPPYAPESASPVNVSADEQFAQPLPSPADVSQNVATHETSPLLKVLYIVGAVIFFAIYTIFWIKVFNLPFLF